VLSPYLLVEVGDTLREPRVRVLRGLTDAQIDAFVGALADVAHVVKGTYAVDLVSRDPDDNPVVACALEADAPFVVTDDRKHLLPLKAVRIAGHRTIQLVSPVEFLRRHL
jgi:predicted nucleic acid-binding protein